MQQHIGWVLLALMAALLFLFLTRKKVARESVTHKMAAVWDSRTDPGPPSATSAPPFQDAAGNLVCADGYSLWQDAATGNYACYKNPETANVVPFRTRIITPLKAANQQDIFGGQNYT